MSNIPQRRTSQTHSADSWHSAPSPHSFSSSINNTTSPTDPAASPPESLVDLNPGIPVSNNSPQTSSDRSSVLINVEKRKCWICLAEEGEMTPSGTPVSSSRWSKACACSLDAHESCLITWINQSRGGDASKNVIEPCSS
jgi:hypothetical protein